MKLASFTSNVDDCRLRGFLARQAREPPESMAYLAKFVVSTWKRCSLSKGMASNWGSVDVDRSSTSASQANWASLTSTNLGNTTSPDAPLEDVICSSSCCKGVEWEREKEHHTYICVPVRFFLQPIGWIRPCSSEGSYTSLIVRRCCRIFWTQNTLSHPSFRVVPFV